MIAQRSESDFLLVHKQADHEDPMLEARVLDLDAKTFFAPFPLQSILARGYWEATSMSEKRLDSLLEGITVDQGNKRLMPGPPRAKDDGQGD